MNNSKLEHTHKKLTIIFTGVVFCIVLILGFSTLGAKYFNDMRIQSRDFNIQSSTILKGIESETNFLQNFLLKKSLEGGKTFGRLREELENGNRFNLSFFIINEKQEIVFQNIVENPGFGAIDLNKKSEEAFLHNGYIIKIYELEKRYPGNSLVFFKKIVYNPQELQQDVLLLLMITILFGVLFYFIGYRFVGRALQPVEENLQDMKDFIHNAGHELKTPLAIMHGNLQVMQAEKKMDPILLQESLQEIHHMNGLIEGLRELSELGKLSQKEPLSLTEEIENIHRDFQDMIHQKNIEFLGLVLPDYIVYANRQELHLMLSNLIKNAIKYTPDFGKIALKLQKNKLSITDTGIGISRDDQDKIFERFFQGGNIRSKDGYGIGLSLVKKIADTNGWKIQVKSELGKGTTFTINF